MKKTILSLALMCIAFSSIGRQKPPFHIILTDEDTTSYYKYTWTAKHYIDILKSMNVKYKKPEGFKEVPGVECFHSIPKLKYMLRCLTNELYANDGHFLSAKT